ncbi:uncharacterized protein VTP21DRAFT_162 [Calcarisporiella thermophila]|uniref:uncharacterized protein n=1 Tax=Calcarisporiella thermophila TaxID=911321 RepID=UPI0037436184
MLRNLLKKTGDPPPDTSPDRQGRSPGSTSPEKASPTRSEKKPAGSTTLHKLQAFAGSIVTIPRFVEDVESNPYLQPESKYTSSGPWSIRQPEVATDQVASAPSTPSPAPAQSNPNPENLVASPSPVQSGVSQTAPPGSMGVNFGSIPSPALDMNVMSPSMMAAMAAGDMGSGMMGGGLSMGPGIMGPNPMAMPGLEARMMGATMMNTNPMAVGMNSPALGSASLNPGIGSPAMRAAVMHPNLPGIHPGMIGMRGYGPFSAQDANVASSIPSATYTHSPQMNFAQPHQPHFSPAYTGNPMANIGHGGFAPPFGFNQSGVFNPGIATTGYTPRPPAMFIPPLPQVGNIPTSNGMPEPQVPYLNATSMPYQNPLFSPNGYEGGHWPTNIYDPSTNAQGQSTRIDKQPATSQAAPKSSVTQSEANIKQESMTLSQNAPIKATGSYTRRKPVPTYTSLQKSVSGTKETQSSQASDSGTTGNKPPNRKRSKSVTFSEPLTTTFGEESELEENDSEHYANSAASSSSAIPILSKSAASNTDMASSSDVTGIHPEQPVRSTNAESDNSTVDYGVDTLKRQLQAMQMQRDEFYKREIEHRRRDQQILEQLARGQEKLERVLAKKGFLSSFAKDPVASQTEPLFPHRLPPRQEVHRMHKSKNRSHRSRSVDSRDSGSRSLRSQNARDWDGSVYYDPYDREFYDPRQLMEDKQRASHRAAPPTSRHPYQPSREELSEQDGDADESEITETDADASVENAVRAMPLRRRRSWVA